MTAICLVFAPLVMERISDRVARGDCGVKIILSAHNVLDVIGGTVRS